MFSRDSSDLLELDSGHPHIRSALVFDGDNLLRLEATWLDGMGLPEQLDADCLERILIAARAERYELSIGSRRTVRLRDGSFRESLRAKLDLPDPLTDGGRDVRIHLVLGYDPANATEAWDAQAMSESLDAWGKRSVSAITARFPHAAVTVEAVDAQRMDIEVSRLRGEGLKLRPMRREVFRLVSDAGIVR